jgi:hypothetical protein
LIEIEGRTTTAPRRRVISMPLPPFNYDRLVDHAGQWRLDIMGTAETAIPYQVFWLVDDRRVHFEVARADKRYRVHDKFTLKGRLLLDNKPLPPKHIQQCEVKVASPVIDLGQFLKDYQVSPAVLKELKRKAKMLGLSTETELKLYALSHDQKAVAKCIQRQVQSVRLKYQDGYLASSITFDKPGIHQFDLHVRALDSKKSQIVRTCTTNVFVQ